MSYVKKFETTLNELFKRRTEWLCREITDFKPGPPNAWNKKIRDSGVNSLLEIAEDILATDFAKKEFEKHPPKYRIKIKGWGDDKKKDNFKTSYDENISMKNCVYIFFGKNNKCLWVGRTEDGKGRPASHFEKKWAKDATRINIYPVNNKTQLHPLECLAWHSFTPKFNKNKPARGKNEKACPMCNILHNINTEMKSIFALK